MSKGRVKIKGSDGAVMPFMRGILAHSLVKRGFEFNKAYKIAQIIKHRLAKMDVVASSKLKDMIADEVQKHYGAKYIELINQYEESNESLLHVITRGTRLPFSRGMLAKSITAAGISPINAYQLADAVRGELQEAGQTKVSSEDLFKRVQQRITEQYGEETAQAYQLTSQIELLERPLIIYLTGAVGTGKSSLATDLASRLGIPKVNGTDMIRQIMRIVFSEQILPALHKSSFQVGELESVHGTNTTERLLSGYVWQCSKVCVGVRAVVERAIEENINMIVEGVHLLPTLVQFPDLANKAYHVPIVLSINDEKVHRSRFEIRHKGAKHRQADRYLSNFKNIRLLHNHFIETAVQLDIDIVDNTDFDDALDELVQIVINHLQTNLVIANEV